MEILAHLPRASTRLNPTGIHGRLKGHLLSCALLSLALLTGCQDEVTPHTTQAKTHTVASQRLIQSPSYTLQQEFSGTVRAGNTTGMGFELAGKLELLMVDSGDRVQQGQLLATLDTRLLQAEQDELSASLAQVQADLDLAISTLKRSLELKQQGYVSQQQLDEVKSQLSNLQAGKQRLQASLQANRLKQDKSSLLAPFDGSIGRRHHNLGEVVAAGSPVFTLVDANNTQAHIGVPVETAQTLAQGQEVSVRVGTRDFNTHIAGISTQVDPMTRTVEVRVTLPQDAGVINGEIAYLNYEQRVIQPGYWVPISALTDGLRGLWNIYIIRPDGDDSYLVELRDVEILYTDKAQAYVRGALVQDELIVTEGLHKLVAGQRVKPNTQLALR
jgi:membrane fusion protein, multidrug efflux system